MSPFSVLLGNPRKLWISRGSLFARQWPLPFRDTIHTSADCSKLQLLGPPADTMDRQRSHHEDDASSQALLRAEEGQQGAQCPVTQPPSLLEYIWSEII